MERLNKAVQLATTADLQRAAMFLEGPEKSEKVLVVSAPMHVLLKQLRGRKRLTTR